MNFFALPTSCEKCCVANNANRFWASLVRIGYTDWRYPGEGPLSLGRGENVIGADSRQLYSDRNRATNDL